MGDSVYRKNQLKLICVLRDYYSFAAETFYWTSPNNRHAFLNQHDASCRFICMRWKMWTLATATQSTTHRSMFNRSLFCTFFICSGSSSISSSPEFWERISIPTDGWLFHYNQRKVCPRLRCDRTMFMVVLSSDTEWVGSFFIPHIQLLNCITACEPYPRALTRAIVRRIYAMRQYVSTEWSNHMLHNRFHQHNHCTLTHIRSHERIVSKLVLWPIKVKLNLPVNWRSANELAPNPLAAWTSVNFQLIDKIS